VLTDKERMELYNLRRRVVSQKEEIKRITDYAKRLEGLLEELRRQHEALR